MIDPIVMIAVGLALVAASRWLAYNFRISGEHRGFSGAMIRLGGLYDDYPSQLYRWVTAVLVGVAFVVVGIVSLATAWFRPPPARGRRNR